MLRSYCGESKAKRKQPSAHEQGTNGEPGRDNGGKPIRTPVVVNCEAVALAASADGRCAKRAADAGGAGTGCLACGIPADPLWTAAGDIASVEGGCAAVASTAFRGHAGQTSDRVG